MSIYFEEGKDYYILQDNQGANFAAGVVYESIQEIFEQFQSWAESDGMDDPKLTGWGLADILEHWMFSIKKWDINDFKYLDISAKEFEETVVADYKLK